MNNLPGAFATGFYNASTVFLFAHAFMPITPLVVAADVTARWGDRFMAAQQRADSTRGIEPWGKDQQ